MTSSSERRQAAETSGDDTWRLREKRGDFGLDGSLGVREQEKKKDKSGEIRNLNLKRFVISFSSLLSVFY